MCKPKGNYPQRKCFCLNLIDLKLAFFSFDGFILVYWENLHSKTHTVCVCVPGHCYSPWQILSTQLLDTYLPQRPEPLWRSCSGLPRKGDLGLTRMMFVYKVTFQNSPRDVHWRLEPRCLWITAEHSVLRKWSCQTVEPAPLSLPILGTEERA